MGYRGGAVSYEKGMSRENCGSWGLGRGSKLMRGLWPKALIAGGLNPAETDWFKSPCKTDFLVPTLDGEWPLVFFNILVLCRSYRLDTREGVQWFDRLVPTTPYHCKLRDTVNCYWEVRLTTVEDCYPFLSWKGFSRYWHTAVSMHLRWLFSSYGARRN